MAVEIRSGRGAYRLIALAVPTGDRPGAILTLTLARADGIEKISLQCRVSPELVDISQVDLVIARLAPWIERDFEQLREAALKSIRSERRLLELVFDSENRGPF